MHDIGGWDRPGRTTATMGAVPRDPPGLEKAVDADSKADDDRTPLSWAAGNGHEAVAKLLALAGSDAGRSAPELSAKYPVQGRNTD